MKTSAESSLANAFNQILLRLWVYQWIYSSEADGGCTVPTKVASIAGGQTRRNGRVWPLSSNPVGFNVLDRIPKRLKRPLNLLLV